MGERIEPLLLRWPRALAEGLANALLPTLLPNACALCGEGARAAVCVPCTLRYAAPGGARCPCCANPLGPGELPGQACGACLADEPAYDATVVAVDYAAPLDGLVLGLKFGARLPLAPWCANLLVEAALARPGWPLPDLLCPVPLGPRRLRERGFNQALEIARPLAAALGVILLPRLATRAVETAAQSGVAPRVRARNIRGAFEFAPEMADKIQGRHVGVVDDVMTSGNTLNELAAHSLP
jgi:predicted amidophosphoribosyltransferase